MMSKMSFGVGPHFLVSRRHFFLHACPVLRRVGAQCGCSAFADLTHGLRWVLY